MMCRGEVRVMTIFLYIILFVKKNKKPYKKNTNLLALIRIVGRLDRRQ